MKITRSQWMLVATACLIVGGSAAQSNVDRPPGVDENSWVPISDTAGIVLPFFGPLAQFDRAFGCGMWIGLEKRLGIRLRLRAIWGGRQ